MAKHPTSADRHSILQPLKRGLFTAALAGLIAGVLATMIFVGPAPASGCIIVQTPARNVFLDAKSVYEVEADGDEVFSIRRTLRGASVRGQILAPAVMLEVMGENWDCTAQEEPEPGEIYVLEASCPPVRQARGLHLLDCEAWAWNVRDHSVYLDFMLGHEVVERRHLRRRLRRWASGKLATRKFSAWLSESNANADVADWTSQRRSEAESLTAELLEVLSDLFMAIAKCPESTIDARQSFEGGVYSDLLELLASKVASPWEDVPYALIEVLDDLVMDAEDAAYVWDAVADAHVCESA